jgi:hypothetical protein
MACPCRCGGSTPGSYLCPDNGYQAARADEPQAVFWRHGNDGLFFGPKVTLGREFSGRMLCRPSPWHELVEARGGPQIEELGQHEVGLRLDAG